MDEAVVRALTRWPDVPDCHGWLALTRRGEWRIGADRERITHAGLTEFINRNYLADAQGAWFFQNGPQRVWVSLDYTPLVFRLTEAAPLRVVAHTGAGASRIDRIILDGDGSLILATDLGPGVVDDRDLPALLPLIRGTGPRTLEEDLADPDSPLCFGLDRMPIERLAGARIEVELGFRRHPVSRGAN